MTAQETRTAVEQVLGTVPFEPPVGVNYCMAVRDALRPLVTGQIDVYHRHVELVVQVRDGERRAEFRYPLI